MNILNSSYKIKLSKIIQIWCNKLLLPDVLYNLLFNYIISQHCFVSEFTKKLSEKNKNIPIHKCITYSNEECTVNFNNSFKFAYGSLIWDKNKVDHPIYD